MSSPVYERKDRGDHWWIDFTGAERVKVAEYMRGWRAKKGG